MPRSPNNPEPPAACPACGYDTKGALSTRCPECGVDVVKECTRLGPRRPVAGLLVPLTLGTSLWLAIVALAMVNFVMESELGLDVMTILVLLCTLLTQAVPLALGIIHRRRFSHFARPLQDLLVQFAWYVFAAPLVLFGCLILMRM